jgi:ABC-type glycerol-3-phosphate transport system substrate-binding protein
MPAAPTIDPTPAAPSPAGEPPKKGLSRGLIFTLGIVLVVVVLGVLAYLLFFGGGPGSQPAGNGEPTAAVPQTSLTYWGLWESESTMRPLLDEFEARNPGITVNYQMQSPQDYRERLQAAMNSATPPDVVRFHSTWLPMLVNSLQPAPGSAITVAEIQANFYQAASSAVVLNSQVYGAPTTMEGLALFTNDQLLSTVQASIPRDWQELRDTAKLLTQRDQAGNLVQSGVALGTASNVDHWPDIVTLMLLQNGVDLRTMSAEQTREALLFYSYFNSLDRVWDATLPSSTQAFAAGQVAMILAPSWRAVDIKAANPSLQWQVSPAPQLPGATPVSLVHFWVEGVPRASQNSDAAWRLVRFLASSEAQQLLWTSASAERGFGQAPAHRALAEIVSANPIVGPYIQQADFAQTFYTISMTHAGETSINERLIKYLEDAINSLVASPGSAASVVETLRSGFIQVLSQYNLVAPAAPASQPTISL